MGLLACIREPQKNHPPQRMVSPALRGQIFLRQSGYWKVARGAHVISADIMNTSFFLMKNKSTEICSSLSSSLFFFYSMSHQPMIPPGIEQLVIFIIFHHQYQDRGRLKPGFPDKVSCKFSNKPPLRNNCLSYGLFFIILMAPALTTEAQCPPNIGFETGTFDHWNCYTGKAFPGGNMTSIVTGEVPGRHTLLKDEGYNFTDPYGHFSIFSPDGSGYSVQLGNDKTVAQAERLSYTFTVPPGQQDYSLIYNYAVVLENPSHEPDEQPRFTSKILDVATNEYITCASFDIISSSNLPGFEMLDTTVDGRQSQIWFKKWSAVTVKLLGYAGKTIRLEFTTYDCSAGAHFGYAYIDVNYDCGPPIKGNTFCSNQASTVLVSPLGYKEYYWYDAGLTNLLGTGNVLTLDPVPANGTVYKLVIVPFESSGCRDTLVTTIISRTTEFIFNVPASAFFCDPPVADLTKLPDRDNSPGLHYSFYYDPEMLQPIREPDKITIPGTYYIRGVNDEGCLGLKPVTVTMGNPPEFTVTNPLPISYVGPADLTKPGTITGNISGYQVSYWKDPGATIPLLNPSVVDIPGVYYIKVDNSTGCAVIKPVIVITSISILPNIFSPNGDGVHDQWTIPNLGNFPDCTVDIFNRYGQIVFHSTGYNPPWDGKIKGKPVPAGTYYYIIRVDNRFPRITGFVDVIY